MARPAKIDREMILRAAEAQVALGGLDSLSMRALGKDLGVEAMSLYRHVGSRDELIASLREAVFESVELPAPVDSARRDLEAVCQTVWSSLAKREASCHLVASAEGAIESARPIFERLLTTLESFIVEPLDRTYAGAALFHFVVGQAILAARPGIPPLVRASSAVVSDGPPALARIVQALEHRSPEVEFELGLRALLDAMESRSVF